MKEIEIIPLIIERENKSGLIWGRVEYQDDLLADSAKSLDELEVKMGTLLNKVSGIGSQEFRFDINYDLTAFFTEKNYLNLSAIAERTGINRSLLAQYASGIKFPSVDRADEIEKAINGFGHELTAVKLALRGKSLPSDRRKESETEGIDHVLARNPKVEGKVPEVNTFKKHKTTSVKRLKRKA
jgi:transcriptional regulator with XRE-family HTH domain